ncbi:MAG: phosphoribosyltransferase [Candidatus Omnitrophica bacterium]|nr:phosphoribosyltransferase [Candidatus Omnitrophota bacterium]
MIQLDFAKILKKLNGVNFPEVDLVVGIETGGMVPASLIAYKLGKDLRLISINYRDEKNHPRYDHPRVLKPWRLPSGVKKILLVDDVSVTGETLKAAQKMLKPCKVVTFVLLGKADFVLFPKIRECVDWPWKLLRRSI